MAIRIATMPKMMRWTYFFPAAFFGSYLLLSNGVPLLPVLLGCAAAAAVLWFRKSRETKR